MKKLFGIVTLVALCVTSYARGFIVESFHAPTQYVKKAYGDDFTFTDPVLYIEIWSSGKILDRTDGQSIKGNKSDFYFGKKINVTDNKFPVVIKIMVGAKEKLELGRRAAISSGVGATIGGIIGGFCAGFVTGGLGAPAGAAIGIAIGGAVGAGGALLVPIKGASEVASFYIDSYMNMKKTHEKSCGNDILSDGQCVKLVVK